MLLCSVLFIFCLCLVYSLTDYMSITIPVRMSACTYIYIYIYNIVYAFTYDILNHECILPLMIATLNAFINGESFMRQFVLKIGRVKWCLRKHYSWRDHASPGNANTRYIWPRPMSVASLMKRNSEKARSSENDSHL